MVSEESRNLNNTLPNGPSTGRSSHSSGKLPPLAPIVGAGGSLSHRSITKGSSMSSQKSKSPPDHAPSVSHFKSATMPSHPLRSSSSASRGTKDQTAKNSAIKTLTAHKSPNNRYRQSSKPTSSSKKNKHERMSSTSSHRSSEMLQRIEKEDEGIM